MSHYLPCPLHRPLHVPYTSPTRPLRPLQKPKPKYAHRPNPYVGNQKCCESRGKHKIPSRPERNKRALCQNHQAPDWRTPHPINAMLLRTHVVLFDGNVRLFRTRDVSPKIHPNSTLHEWGMGWPRIDFLAECTFISLGTDPRTWLDWL